MATAINFINQRDREDTSGLMSLLKRAVFLSVLAIVMGSMIGCDDDDFQTAKSPLYDIRPVAEFIFPTLVVGRSTTKEIEIENVGEADLLIARSIVQSRTSGANGEEFIIKYSIGDGEVITLEYTESEAGAIVEGTYPLRLTPGEIMNVSVTYTPEDEVIDAGAIYFETNVIDEENPERSRINLPIRVTNGGAEIDVRPGSLDFGSVRAGEEKTLEVTITNVGQTVLNLYQLRIDGSQDFTPLIDGRDPRRQPTLLEDPDRDDLPGISPVIEGGNSTSVVIQVRYAPAVAGPDSATLVIESNAIGENRSKSIPLKANSENPCLDVLPAALEFPASLVSRTDSRSVILESCGGATLSMNEIFIEDDAEGVFGIEGELELPLELSAAEAQGIRPSSDLSISFSPREQKIYNATLVIRSNDPVTPERRVSILGRGTENICPQARATEDEFYVLPLDTIVLDGTPSVDQDGPNNLPVEYDWVITARPEGSISQPVERFDNPQQPADGGRPDDLSTPLSLFFIDLPGYYTAELRVRDQFGLDSIACRNSAIVTIVAQPDEAIQVQLLWEPVSEIDIERERAADLDLHLTHPNATGWFSQPYDCFFRNPEPDWGQLDNPQDNPFLDLDDFSSTGPENLSLATPENTDILGGDYKVGIDYYSNIDRIDGFEYGTVKAFVRIFINGDLAWDYTDGGDPGFKEMSEMTHFWEAASISWPSGEVTKIDEYYTERPE